MLIYGYDNAGSSSDQPSQDVQDAVEAVFIPVSNFMNQDLDTITFPYEYVNGITFAFDGTSTLTATFNGYADINTGYTIDGTITISKTISSDNSTLTISASGTVTLTGGLTSELVFDIKLSVSYDMAEDDFASEPTPSGTITADGTSYDLADFNLFGEADGGGDGVPATINPHFIVAGMKVENPAGSGTYYSIVVFSDNGSAWGYPNVT